LLGCRVDRGAAAGKLARRASLAFGLALALALLAATPVPAAANNVIYRYIDDRGVVHFSQAPRDSRFHAVEMRPRGLTVSPSVRPSLPVNHGYDRLIVRSAREFDLEPALVKAVIAAESNFSRVAVSRAGAQGLMQLMPATARDLGVTDPFHAVQNVSGGSRYLREMLDRYGDLQRALAAYNAGPEAVDRYHGVPPYPETQAYVKRVLNYYRGYRGDFDQ
jgi:soluble lytic murein transglycosylase-like protein